MIDLIVIGIVIIVFLMISGIYKGLVVVIIIFFLGENLKFGEEKLKFDDVFVCCWNVLLLIGDLIFCMIWFILFKWFFISLYFFLNRLNNW